MEKFVERLIIEKHELELRHDKLIAIVNSPLWDTFESNEKSLLSIQLRAMQTYLECLEQRLKKY